MLSDADCFKSGDASKQWIRYGPLRAVWNDVQTFVLAPFALSKSYYASELLFVSIPAFAQAYLNATAGGGGGGGRY